MTVNVNLNGRDNPNSTSLYGTVGTSAMLVLTATPAPSVTSNRVRSFLQIHSPSSSASVACTFDGTNPVVNGAGYTIGPLGLLSFDTKILQGPVKIIGSGSSTPYTITTM